MNNLIQLDAAQHQHLRIDTDRIARHAAEQRMMPIVISEFQNCAIHFPILISKNAESGAFVCTALFGFDQGENLFWKDGKWDALYTPLNIQRQPFFIGSKEDDNGDDYVLCIDRNSPSVSDNNGEKLFEDNRQPSAYLQKAQSTLRELLQGEAETKVFLDKLLELDLIAPLSLDITFNNQQSQRVDGAYTISEEKLAQLSDEQILSLHKAGYMGLIYTMFVSLGQLYPLIERKNHMLEHTADWFAAAEA